MVSPNKIGQDWVGAERMFTAAFTGLGEQAVLWDGLGYAQLPLGRIQSFSHAIANQPTNALYHLSSVTGTGIWAQWQPDDSTT